MAEQKAKKEQLRQKCEVEMNATVERLSEAAASGTAARATTGKDQSILDGSMELKSKIAKAVDAMQR